MSQTVTFSEISLSKTKAILGHSTDISHSQSSNDDEFYTVNPSWHKTLRDAKRPGRGRDSPEEVLTSERDIMLSQGKTFKDFENLLVALDALERWQNASEEGKR